jgi:hypothetical protein
MANLLLNIDFKALTSAPPKQTGSNEQQKRSRDKYKKSKQKII